MKKFFLMRLFSVVLVFTMAFMLFACGEKKSDGEDSVYEKNTETTESVSQKENADSSEDFSSGGDGWFDMNL